MEKKAYAVKKNPTLNQVWREMASDHERAPQHTPKIILGALLSRTLDIKIARLVLIFNLVLVLHFSPKEKCFIITHFETTFLLLSKLCFEPGTLEMIV